MKLTHYGRFFLFFAVLALVLAFAGCEDSPETPSINNLSGTINISPNANVTTGTELTANYSGSESVSYQWKRGETNVGTNSNKYIPTIAGSYTVTVSAQGYNSKTSVSVIVTVPADLPGTITISPSTDVTTGMELTASYSGSVSVSYQWRRGDVNVGTNSNKYTPAIAGSYTVTVSAEGYNSKTSAVVTVTTPPGVSDLSGTITISPDTNVTTNTELTATYSGSETVSYQWEKDGSDVGTNSNKYTPTETGSYTVTVSADGYNSKISAAIEVIDPALPYLSGTITISPNTNVTTGMELTANYSGSESVSYQWKRDDDNVGTNSNKYTPTVSGNYTVTLNADGYNSKTSAAVTVTVPISDPDLSGTITISPDSNVTIDTELTATYSGSESVSYQWKRGETNVGTNSNKYTPTEAGSYTVTVSADGYNSKTSAAVTVNSSTSNGDPNNPFDDPSVPTFTSITELTNYLDATVEGVTIANPVRIKVNMNLREEWENIVNALNDVGRYITLDFSGSIGTTITGSDSLSSSRIVSVTLPNTITSIGTYAFNSFSSLTSITIPDNVISIGAYAFQNCSRLTSIIIPDSITSIGSYAFSDCSGLASITIPNSVTTIGTYAFAGCSGLASIIIPNSVTTIGIYAFAGCRNLTSIIIPESITSIRNYTFSGCSGLASITIPNSVITIGGYTFQGCTSLSNITIPDSVTSIGSYAFYLCSSLTSITIPDSVTSIGSYAFRDCSKLTSVLIPANVTTWDSAFYYCSGLVSVIISDGVTNIGTYAFRDCSNLTSVTIPDSVTSIGSYAFSGCSNLTSVIVPANVTTWDSAFSGCSGLVSVIISDGITFIENNAFRNCSNLTSVTIGNSVTGIGTYAFSGCSSLISITIPASVRGIDSYAFSNCTNLISVTFDASDTSIQISSFPDGGDLYGLYSYSSSGAGTYTRTSSRWTKQ